MTDRNQYRSVIGVLLLLAGAGTIAVAIAGLTLWNPALLDGAVTLGLATGVLLGVALAQAARTRPKSLDLAEPSVAAAEEAPEGAPVSADSASISSAPSLEMSMDGAQPASPRGLTASDWWRRLVARAGQWWPDARERANVRFATAAVGIGATTFIRLLYSGLATSPTPFEAGIAALLPLGGVVLAATAVRYFVEIDPAALPEGPGLARGARLVGWILVVCAASVGLQWWGQDGWLRPLDFALVLINAWIRYDLLIGHHERDATEIFSLDLAPLAVFGSRTNILGSILDAAEGQLGIDLRSSWALTVVRRSVEPLVIGLCLLVWLSTSLTVVGIEEQGLAERFGVPRGGPPLSPGLHLHLPWPIDRVFRLPIQRVQSLSVGHEGQESGGPEDVLWAREHAANEYTLLLGNGRDLITVDAAVQFRIRDARAWHYHCQNPADALLAIAYRAVMRNTVNRTLADALSENLVATTARMREMVQQDADALDLGIEVLGFTVGGMHPPVAVALDYQSVVSAELGKVTAVVNAQALRNQTVPYAEAGALTGANAARAEGAEALAAAAGEAWSFLTLQAQYRAAPAEYMYRRRLETLEKGLLGRRFTIVDSRFQRDGGELWLTP